MDYKEIENLVRLRAREIAGVKNLKIKFSDQMTRSYALCYWQETPQAIYFNKTFIDLNKNNNRVITELIIHECIHLIPGCNRHNRKFMNKCQQYEIELYGYSTDIKDVKPIFATHCTKCGSFKAYFVKPSVTRCKLCKGKLKLIDCEKKYGA